MYGRYSALWDDHCFQFENSSFSWKDSSSRHEVHERGSRSEESKSSLSSSSHTEILEYLKELEGSYKVGQEVKLTSSSQDLLSLNFYQEPSTATNPL